MNEELEKYQKATLKRTKITAFIMAIFALVAVVVFVFGVNQRIELEKENASLKQQIEVFEANADSARVSGQKAAEMAIEAMKLAKKQMAFYEANPEALQQRRDSIKNANK